MPRAVGLSVCLLIAATTAGCAIAQPPPSDPSPLLGKRVDPKTAMSLRGIVLDLPASRRVTVFEVWATWCRPSADTMPAIERLWEDERAAGVEVIGIATDDNPGLVQRAVDASGVGFANVVDATGDLRGWLLVRELPAAVVFDREGRIRWMREGLSARDVRRLREVVEALREDHSS
jgi:thiol-disulfide isomerase/thioredoxin